MDNVSFHKTAVVRQFLTSNRIRYDYLPRYSPELNPIEEVFSMLKSQYYRLERPNNYEEIKRNVIACLSNWETYNTNFENFYEHMKMYLDKSFTRENF